MIQEWSMAATLSSSVRTSGSDTIVSPSQHCLGNISNSSILHYNCRASLCKYLHQWRRFHSMDHPIGVDMGGSTPRCWRGWTGCNRPSMHFQPRPYHWQRHRASSTEQMLLLVSLRQNKTKRESVEIGLNAMSPLTMPRAWSASESALRSSGEPKWELML